MENHRDEHIVCADCGASFLFSAGEAAVFEERGLASPKRCKDCRRARKDRTSSADGAPRGPRPQPGSDGGWNGGARDAGPPRARFDGAARGPRRGFQSGPARQGPPRYTGDVNEYRSPMQDGNAWQQPQWQGYGARTNGNGWQQPMARAPRRGGPGVYRDDGEYRAPSGNDGNFARADRSRAQSAGAPAKRRPQGEMHSITCNSCGAAAEVPFKPAEGRDVFCQACYRARKPAV